MLFASWRLADQTKKKQTVEQKSKPYWAKKQTIEQKSKLSGKKSKGSSKKAKDRAKKAKDRAKKQTIEQKSRNCIQLPQPQFFGVDLPAVVVTECIPKFIKYSTVIIFGDWKLQITLYKL